MIYPAGLLGYRVKTRKTYKIQVGFCDNSLLFHTQILKHYSIKPDEDSQKDFLHSEDICFIFRHPFYLSKVVNTKQYVPFSILEPTVADYSILNDIWAQKFDVQQEVKKKSGFAYSVDLAPFQLTNQVLLCGIGGSDGFRQLISEIVSERFNLPPRVSGDRLGVEVEVGANAEVMAY